MSLLHTMDTRCGIGTTRRRLFHRNRHTHTRCFSSQQSTPNSAKAPVQFCGPAHVSSPSVTDKSPPRQLTRYSQSVSVYTVDSLPRRRNPHPTQTHYCYYYQDLHTRPLHIRSRRSFDRTVPPPYLTQPNSSRMQTSSPPFSQTPDSVGTLQHVS